MIDLQAKYYFKKGVELLISAKTLAAAGIHHFDNGGKLRSAGGNWRIVTNWVICLTSIRRRLTSNLKIIKDLNKRVENVHVNKKSKWGWFEGKFVGQYNRKATQGKVDLIYYYISGGWIMCGICKEYRI